MAKFVLMFHGGETPEEPSPEVMDRWMAWFGELGEAVVDMGAPFGRVGDDRVGWNTERGKRTGPGERLHGHRGRQPSRCRRHGQGMSGAEQRRFGQAVRGDADGLTRPRESARSRATDCASLLPEVNERMSHGEPCFFVRDKRPLCYFHDDHNGDGRISLWCPVPPGVQEEMVSAEPVRFFAPPTSASGVFSGWLGRVSRYVRDAQGRLG